MNIDMLSVGYILVVLVAILFSMTLHEAMHAFVAYWLGDDTAKIEGRLTLNPIKHIDPFMTIILPLILALTGAPIFGGAKPVPFNPHNIKWGEWGAMLIALAGPLTNLFMAFIAFGLLASLGSLLGGAFGSVLVVFINVNLGFFAFNMIPIPPLDGSRVIYALAPEFIKRGMEAIEKLGIMTIFVIILVTGPIIGVFMTNIINFFLGLFSNFFGL